MAANRSKFLRFLIAAMALLAALPAICCSEQQIVRIGVIVPLSGDMALHGVEVQRAMRLAQQKAAAGHYRYELLFEDNRLEGAKSISAAQHLLDVAKVDAIVTLWPPTAMVVMPLTERRQVLHYTISWDPELARRSKYVLSHQAMVDKIAASSLELLKQQKKTWPAFLHMRESGFDIGAGHLRRLAAEAGAPFAADEEFASDERDFRPLLARIKKARPDSFLVWSVMPSIDTLIRQLREREPQAFVSGYLDYAEDLSQLEGAVYVSEMYAEPEFIQAYRKASGAPPVSKGANAYDIYNLLLWAYEQHQGGKPSAAKLKGSLIKSGPHKGAVGTFSIDAEGNSSYAPVWRTIRKGERLLLPRW